MLKTINRVNGFAQKRSARYAFTCWNGNGNNNDIYITHFLHTGDRVDRPLERGVRCAEVKVTVDSMWSSHGRERSLIVVGL